MVKGWAKKSIGELFDISGGLSASRAQLSDKGFLYLHYGDIHGSKRTFIDVSDDGSIPRLNIPLEKISKVSFLEDGDVVFVDASEDDDGASRHIVVRNLNGIPFISGLHTIVAKAKTDELVNLFKEFCFQTADVRAQFKFYSSGTKVVGVNKSNIKDITIFFPISKDEQNAIATALSDMNEYISALEKLIAKKRLIKQGVMQELLTGKLRLPRFSEEWVMTPLCEIADGITMGQSPNSQYYNLQIGLPLIQGKADIECRHTVVHFYTPIITKIGNKDDIIMTVRAPVGSIAKADFDCCLGRGVCAIKGNEFLYQLLIYFEPQWNSISTGSTFDSISGGELNKVRFMIPTDKNEQIAIAEILSDMDAEIDALTAKLNKAKQIKQGMMRELLTGRIRLIGTEPNKSADESYPKAKNKSSHKTEKQPTVKGHNLQFDDAVMIAGIVNAFYHDKYPLGRKKVQKCLYLLRRHQNESTKAFKKKAAGPYADEVRYKGGEPIAKKSGYIDTTTSKQGTTFSRGKNISQALGYIESWGKQDDIQWVADNLRFKKVDELELLATVDMASCDLTNEGIPVTVQSIKHLIETNKEWKAKLEKQIFSDANIERAISELQTLLRGGN